MYRSLHNNAIGLRRRRRPIALNDNLPAIGCAF
jgi:hypothetical protein